LDLLQQDKQLFIKKIFKKKLSNYKAVVPDQVNVVVTVPVGRNNTVFSAEASSILVQELADGTVDTVDFMRKIKDSIQTL
jgi:hypothetical protein